MRTYALVVGLHALCEPSPSARQVLAERADLAPLRFELAAELESALRLVLVGLEAEAER
jgi:hypothetical protein